MGRRWGEKGLELAGRFLRLCPVRVMALCVGLSAVILFRCSSSDPVAGGGTTTETTNGVVASVCYPGGEPVRGAVVRLRRSDYVTPVPAPTKGVRVIGADGRTDSVGRFEMRDIEPGSYAIEVNDGRGRSVLMVCTVGGDDTVDLGRHTLLPYAVVVGSMDTVGRSGRSFYVQVVGLERLVAVDDGGRFAIRDLPGGVFRLRVVDAEGPEGPVEIEGVRAVADSVTEVGLVGWRFRKRVYVNTGVSGGNVLEDVYGFPLLVRLDGSVFDFGEASADGSDLRFTKADGTPLAYEIEQWDAAGGRAAVWVRMDTVRGNDSTQYFVMHWGNLSARSLSNGAAVFDTADGWLGVWHLGDDPQNGAVRNYTARALAGTTLGGMSASSLTQGIAGNCLAFDGIDDYVATDSIPGAGLGTHDVTFAAWFMSDTVCGQGILNSVTFSGFPRLRLTIHGDGRLRYGIFDPRDTVWFEGRSSRLVNDGAWHHAAVSFSRRGLARLYVDGVAEDSVDISSTASLVIAPVWFFIGWDYFIGPRPEDGHLRGRIDEPSVSLRARSESFVKLMYESQKPNTTIVRMAR